MTTDNAETLAGSRSPFLQHGATQPVRWMPWGEAAFALARRENRPILLDIGAVWCHWCHVMDRESYEDPEIAALINELFVPVKVDRDERPDVDARYQRAVQTLTGQGGWPLTAFLTPEGDVWYGGTYFPPTEGMGRPSFRRVLRETARIWHEEPQRAQDAVRGIRDRLGTYSRAEVQPGDIDPEMVEVAIEELAEHFDFRFGGFGRAPKFPNAGALTLLLDHHLDTNVEWSARIVRETLDAMARGGIFDQLGGGFHRYSVDARWIIPHFEKMAYDNGVLLDVYARAFAVYGDDLYLRAVRGIIDHYFDIAPELLARGGFPASQDADFSPDDDGDYWTWTLSEVAAVLGDEEMTRVVQLHYGLDDAASSMHLDHSRHVLFEAMPIEDVARRIDRGSTDTAELLERASIQLKRARDQRPGPFVDETVYSGWSALVASGFLSAARYAHEVRAAPVALRALERIWFEGFVPERGLAHRIGDSSSGEYLEDHAWFAQACVDAFEWTQQQQWLDRADQVLQIVQQRFHDTNTGAFTDRPVDAPVIAAPLQETVISIADSPSPAANAVIALTQLRLATLLHRPELRQRALDLLARFAGTAPRLASAAATYMRACSFATRPVTTIVVVTDVEPAQDLMLRTALSTYHPRTAVLRLQPADVATRELAPELAAMVGAETPRAYVCIGNTCHAPVSDSAALQTLLLP